MLFINTLVTLLLKSGNKTNSKKRVLEKVIISELVEKISISYRNQTYITVFRIDLNRTLILNQMNHPHYEVTVSTGFKGNLKQDTYPEAREHSLCCYSQYWIQKQPQTGPLS